MPAFAIAHWYAFSWKDYTDPTISAARMPVQYALRDAYGIRDLIHDTKLTFGGKGYEYRNFDSADGTTMVHPESAARMARIMDGMRYERGGKGKYWIPKPTPSSRTALLGAVGSAAGITDDPARRAAAGVGKPSYGSTAPDELEDSCLDEDIEKLYTDARAMEFGDYNYPVITAYEPYSAERFRQNYQGSSHIITTATNQALLQPENRIKVQSRSRSKKSNASSSRSRKGKGRASDEDEESQGLLAKAADVLHRSSSSSSHISDRSGVVDIIVEDKDAEEVERVRARKEGGPAWNEEDPKVFVTVYPPEHTGETERTGFETDDLPTPVDNREHHTDTSEVNASASQDNFVLAEEGDDDDDGETTDDHPVENGSRPRYGSLSHDANPWGP
ncbi:hypothetical protein ABW20_dc0107059 [Dactylellina cionopaga]|nr:hypothetical protein ABW20_dc0107059 [Dactylellina cionopaga]